MLNLEKYIQGNTLTLFSIENIMEIVNLLENKPSVTEVILKFCNISGEDAKVLANSSCLTNIRNLNLLGNKIGDKGAKAFANSPHLKDINLVLASNSIGDEGAKALASSPYSTNIKRINLEDNNIGIKGLEALNSSPLQGVIHPPLDSIGTKGTNDNHATNSKGGMNNGAPQNEKGNITPENIPDNNLNPQKALDNNGTTFWSEHKGKIVLSVVGLCIVGAIAAYVLAYPVAALALTVLAAAITVAGIVKACEKSEDPGTKKSNVSVSRGSGEAVRSF